MSVRQMTAILVCPVLALSVFSALHAQQDKAAIPRELREAKTAYLLNSGADSRLLDRFTKEITDWNRFTLTEDLKAADISMILSEEQLEAKGGQPAPTLIVFTIAQVPGGPALWTDKERRGLSTGAAANLVKRLRDRLQKAEK